MSVKFAIGEYRVLWEALKRHQSELERESTADEQLLIDDKLQELDDMLRGIAFSAKTDWGIELA